MLYGAEFAVRSEINTKNINIVWAECQFLKFSNCWCPQPIDFKMLRYLLLKTILRLNSQPLTSGHNVCRQEFFFSVLM
jgi:hypothetical protein